MYPSIGDKNFQTKLLEKPEFSELFQPTVPLEGGLEQLKKERNKACGASDFRLQNHQLFLKRFFSDLTPYKSAIFYHGTGVGKTCTSISIGEEFLSQPNNEGKKVIIISSEAVRQNFQKEIFSISAVERSPPYISKQCTSKTYIERVQRLRRSAMNLGSSIDRDRLAEMVDKLITEYYEFFPYQAFSNPIIAKEESLSNKAFQDWIQKTFSNRLIIVDEAHNSRPSQSGKEKKVEQALRAIAKYAENTQLILMSATPMYNDFTEILWLMNLCVWNDKRKELFKSEKEYVRGFTVEQLFNPDGTFKNQDAESLFRVLTRSYISFVRGDDPLRFPFRLPPPDILLLKPTDIFPVNPYGKPVPKSDWITELHLTGSHIGTEQEKSYYKLLGDSKPDLDTVLNEDIQELDEDSTDTNRKIVNQIFARGNISYPDNLSFDKAFLFKKGSATEQVEVQYIPGLTHFLSPEHIRAYAPKMATIINCINDSEGVCFVYSQFKNDGVLALALALEEAGYHPYGNPAGFLTSIPAEKKTKGAYVLLTGANKLNPKDLTFERDVAACRDPANVDGKKVKIILGTKRVNEGVDFKYIRQMHVLEPWFNMSLLDQVIGRAMRTCSHTALPFEKQNTTVYLHALSIPDKESLDIMAYRVSENKAKKIAHIAALLKESAFDCLANYGKNHLHSSLLNTKIPQVRSQDGKTLELPVRTLSSPLFSELTERPCEQSLTDENVPKPDKTQTIPTKFLKDRSEEILKALSELFREESIWNIEDIYSDDRMKPYLHESILAVLTDAERFPNRYIIVDRFGRVGSIQRRGKLFAFLPTDLKNVINATEFERKQIPPILHKLIPAPTTPEIGFHESTNGLKQKTIQKPEKDPIAAFTEHIQKQKDLLKEIDVPQDIIDSIVIPQAFDTFPMKLRYELFHTLIQNEETYTDLYTEIVKPRLTTIKLKTDPTAKVFVIVNPKGQTEFPIYYSNKVLDKNTIPVGSTQASINEFISQVQKDFINLPADTMVGCTEYWPEIQSVKYKLQTKVVDASSKDCGFFKKDQLKVLFATVGYATEASSNKCAGLDAYLRSKATTDPKIKYMTVEFRNLVKTLRKKDFPEKQI